LGESAPSFRRGRVKLGKKLKPGSFVGGKGARFHYKDEVLQTVTTPVAGKVRLKREKLIGKEVTELRK